MKVLELKGYKSLRALNAFHALMLGLKMLPMYQHESYEEFYAKVEMMPEADQEKLVREAALFVEIQLEEMEALLSFACDPNGVPYTKENLNNLTPDQLIDVVVAVCMKIAKIKVQLVTDDEKKNFKNSQLTSALSTSNTLN